MVIRIQPPSFSILFCILWHDGCRHWLRPLLFVGTSLALHFLHVKPGLAKNLRFFRLLGVAVIIWGLVYGSFFGFELPFALISTSSDAMTILVISVVFGFITVLAGLFLSGLKNMRLKDYAEAYNAGFAWVLILLGLLLLALGNFFPSLAFAATIGQWLAIINALGILAVSIVSAKSLAGLGQVSLIFTMSAAMETLSALRG